MSTHIVLLSGGSGKRLWPLSNDTRSKQFVKMFKNEDGHLESMVQRVYKQIKQAMPEASITIATSKNQVSAIHNQLNKDVDVCVEPCRKDTFPAIVLASSYLKDVKKVQDDEVVVVCPVDPYVDVDYFERINDLVFLASEGISNINLMGIEPTYPSEKYGYIIPVSQEETSLVHTFKEKPNEEIAKDYISKGALWNGGVFAYKLGYMLKKGHELLDFSSFYDLQNNYEKCTKISFDYAVVEKEESISVLRFKGSWKDIGTWNTFTEEMSEQTIGKVVLNDKCSNTNVVNELDIPILCMGLKDIVIASSVDGILISDKEDSANIKSYVEKFNQQAMYAEKSWGSFTILDIQKESLTIKIVLNAKEQLSYHYHERRDEIWTVVSGEGEVIIDGLITNIKPGSVLRIPKGSKHMLIAKTRLEVVEVQIGKDISVEDKFKKSLVKK